MSSRRILYTIALRGCAIATRPALAQSERGTISGTVHDASGSIVPAANSKVANTATNVALTAMSNAYGDFTVPDLPVGTYQVLVVKEGFRAFALNGITVDRDARI